MDGCARLAGPNVFERGVAARTALGYPWATVPMSKLGLAGFTTGADRDGNARQPLPRGRLFSRVRSSGPDISRSLNDPSIPAIGIIWTKTRTTVSNQSPLQNRHVTFLFLRDKLFIK